MEVTVRREELVRALNLVQGVVERRSPQPILATVLLAPADGSLTLTATDLEIGIRVDVPAAAGRKGAAAVNARKLFEIAREVGSEEVRLRLSAPGWLELVAGRSRFKIVSLDPKEFPALPLTAERPGVTVRLATGTLHEMLDKTLFAVCQDETRYNLAGVFTEAAEVNHLRMVATDGHRLAMIDRALPDVSLPRGVIMPRKGLAEVRKLLDETGEQELTFTVGDKEVQVRTRTVAFFMRLIEGEFPEYRQVIPGAPRVRAQVQRDEFLAALRRIALLASERSHGVKLRFERGVLELSSNNPDLGEASEDLEIGFTGEPLTLGFNSRYLLDVLQVHAAGDTIEIGLTDEAGPAVVRGSQDPTYTYVLMPLRL